MAAILLLRRSWARLFTGGVQGSLPISNPCAGACLWAAAMEPCSIQHLPPPPAAVPRRCRGRGCPHGQRAPRIRPDTARRRLQCSAAGPAQVWAGASWLRACSVATWRRACRKAAVAALPAAAREAAGCTPRCCRGSGRQGTGALANLCSYWVLGIPSAYFLAFRWGPAGCAACWAWRASCWL